MIILWWHVPLNYQSLRTVFGRKYPYLLNRGSQKLLQEGMGFIEKQKRKKGTLPLEGYRYFLKQYITDIFYYIIVLLPEQPTDTTTTDQGNNYYPFNPLGKSKHASCKIIFNYQVCGWKSSGWKLLSSTLLWSCFNYAVDVYNEGNSQVCMRIQRKLLCDTSLWSYCFFVLCSKWNLGFFSFFNALNLQSLENECWYKI